MMFLANMVSKMKADTPLGSRIAEVHNGSSLFTGDAGQGESNIRRWIIENDWLEAIVALPLNMFYNTGIATYVWVLTNRKAEHRQGYVQLIDATKWFTPLRRNLGQKNCELAEDDIERITQAFMAFEETEQSKIFPNAAFGYWKVTVERPLRIAGTEPERIYKAAEIRKLRNEGQRDENAAPIIKKAHVAGTAPDPLHGLFPTTIKGKPVVVEYEPDPDLRGTPNRFRCLKTAASTRSCGEKSYPMRTTPGTRQSKCEDRLRDQLQPPLLPAPAPAPAGGYPR